MNQWQNDLADRLPLDGSWAFSLKGHTGKIRVPGCWESQGYDRRADGPAMMQRTVYVPETWRGCAVQLQFDAVSYFVEASVNDVPAGTHTGSWSPFAFDVSDAIRPGADNTIRLTIYKPGERFPIRESLAGFLPDVALMFGGVWQSARLVAFSGAALENVAVLASAETGEVTVTAIALRAAGFKASITVFSPAGQALISSPVMPGESGAIAAHLKIQEPECWQPDYPACYVVELCLESDQGSAVACARRSFGFRRLAHDGEQLLLNGEPFCARGVLNWGWYPEILCPAPDEDTIRDEFRRVRALGFNMVKLCLYVPSPLYFEIADQEGMLLWLELPMWLPEVTPRLQQQAPIEYADMLAAVHAHPSIVIYSLGCELTSAVGEGLLARLNSIVRESTCGALVCDNSGSGEAYGGLSFDFADFNDYHFYCDLQYFDPLVDHFSRDWRPPRPWIFGEFCDADDYRDVNEVAAVYGGHMPWWLTERNPIHPPTFPSYPEQEARMQAAHTGLDNQALLHLSRQQSFVVRKTILEKVRARAGMGGYVVTGIRDTPLSTSAMFDDLKRSKYAPEAFRAFNADTVLLLGQGRSRVWKRGGDRPAPFAPYTVAAGQAVSFNIILAHTGRSLSGGSLTWRVVGADPMHSAGSTQVLQGPLVGGRPQTIGQIAFRAPVSATALALKIEVELQAAGQQFNNAWPLWVFPEIKKWPEGIGLVDPADSLAGLDDLWESARQVGDQTAHNSILLTSVLTDDMLRFIGGGGSALLLQTGDRPLPALAQPFWREGIKIISDHPAMQTIPHAGFVDLQFYGLATDWAFDTGRLNATLPEVRNLRSLLRRLDARQFTLSDYLIEAEIGAGHLIASTLRFQGGAGDQPAGLNFQLAGRWLLYHLIQSLQSE